MFLAVLCLSVASAPVVCIQVTDDLSSEASCAEPDASYVINLTAAELATYDFSELNAMRDLMQIRITTNGRAELNWQNFNPITGQRVNLTIHSVGQNLEFNWASLGNKISFLELYTEPVAIPVKTLDVDGLAFLDSMWDGPVTGGLQLSTIPCLVFSSADDFSKVVGTEHKGLQKVVFNPVVPMATFTFNTDVLQWASNDLVTTGQIAKGVIAGPLVVNNVHNPYLTEVQVRITGDSSGWSLTVVTAVETVDVQGLTGTGSVSVVSQVREGSNPPTYTTGESVPIAIETAGSVTINPSTGNTLKFNLPIVCTGSLTLQTQATTVTIENLTMVSGGTFSVTAPTTPAMLLADQQVVTVKSAVIASQARINSVTGIDSVDLKAGGSLETSATLNAVTIEYQYTTSASSSPLIQLQTKQDPPKVSLVNGGKASPNGYLHPLYLFALKDTQEVLDTAWVNACKVDDNFEIYQGKWSSYSAILAVPPPPDSDLKLSPGAIAGIVVACVLVVVAIIVLLVYACKARPGSKKEKPPAEETDKKEASSSSMSDI